MVIACSQECLITVIYWYVTGDNSKHRFRRGCHRPGAEHHLPGGLPHLGPTAIAVGIEPVRAPGVGSFPIGPQEGIEADLVGAPLGAVPMLVAHPDITGAQHQAKSLLLADLELGVLDLAPNAVFASINIEILRAIGKFFHQSRQFIIVFSTDGKSKIV